MERGKEREHLMKLLYQMGLTNSFNESDFENYINNNMKGKASEYVNKVYLCLAENVDEIDGIIDKYSMNWKVSRMPAVDLALLRLALTEILFIDSIPESVSINEAVELAKNFSTDKSAKFVNGILGKVVKNEKL